MSIPKAVLYYHPTTVWSSSVLLTLAEKGYGDDELHLKVVDVWKAEHLSTGHLRLNSKGTVPTLVVPLAKTLAPEEDHLYKSLTDVKSILEFLDQSRSVTSHTRTTSAAPAPTLAPAIVALATPANAIIAVLHSEDLNTVRFALYNATTPEELQMTVSQHISKLTDSRSVLADLLSASAPITGTSKDQVQTQGDTEQRKIAASERTRALWQENKSFMDELDAVFSVASKSEGELSPEENTRREAYFAESRALWTIKIPGALLALDKEMIGPFALGDQLSLVDLHICPWFAHVALICGGNSEDSGETIVSKIESRIRHVKGDDDDTFSLPRTFQAYVSPEVRAEGIADYQSTTGATAGAGTGQTSKFAAFWDEMKSRPSWKRLYGASLH